MSTTMSEISNKKGSQFPAGNRTSGMVESHVDYLFRFALARVRDEFIAEDLVQETMLAAFSNMKAFLSKSSVRTWLTAILKNKVSDYFRASARELSIDFAASETWENEFFDENGRWRDDAIGIARNSDPDRQLESGEFWTKFNGALSKMPARIATAFVLREIDGMSSKEVCEILNVSESDYWVMLHRARMLLRREFDQGVLPELS